MYAVLTEKRVAQVAVYAVLTEELNGEQGSAGVDDEVNTLKTSILMELCDRGSLVRNRELIWTRLRQDEKKGLVLVLKCLLEILFGMEYLHSIGIVHGDLKCANVLCCSKVLDVRGFVCKVCDFGLSKSAEGFTEMYTSSPGTALFAAPELLSKGSVGFESDVYAFAILAWHLLSMGSTVGDLHDYQVRYQVVEKGWRPPFSSITPVGLQQLLSRCWAEHREDRPSFTELRGPLTEMLKDLQQQEAACSGNAVA